MTISDQIEAHVQELRVWNKKDDPNFLGDQLHDPIGWNKLRSRQLDIKVVNKGISDIAPHLDDQSSFVLNSLDQGLDNIRMDVGKLYANFQEFATGPDRPIKNLNTLTASQRRTKMAQLREDYLFFLADVAQNSTSLYTSKGLIKNAITTLRMQSKIAESVNALGGKMSKTATYIQLANRLEALHADVSNLGMALQELQMVIKKVKDAPSQRYPKMKTRQGENQFVDKLYYDVLTEWLRVLAHSHKVENAVRAMSAQFAKIEGLKRLVSKHRTELDTLPEILSTYKSINNEAKATFPNYRPMLFESKVKFAEAMDHATKRKSKRRALVEANQNLLSRLEEIF
jgi:hypothetical protein